jgi:hypothetical protein
LYPATRFKMRKVHSALERARALVRFLRGTALFYRRARSDVPGVGNGMLRLSLPQTTRIATYPRRIVMEQVSQHLAA